MIILWKFHTLPGAFELCRRFLTFSEVEELKSELDKASKCVSTDESGSFVEEFSETLYTLVVKDA